jgi:hypothetical protein
VYTHDLESFFFVEVKLKQDRLRPNQEDYFKRLERIVNQEVVLVRLKPELVKGL